MAWYSCQLGMGFGWKLHTARCVLQASAALGYLIIVVLGLSFGGAIWMTGLMGTECPPL